MIRLFLLNAFSVPSVLLFTSVQISVRFPPLPELPTVLIADNLNHLCSKVTVWTDLGISGTNQPIGLLMY